MRTILPILLIVAAIGLFVVYVNPTYQETKALSAKYGQYDSVLTQSAKVRQTRDQLLARRNTFSSDDVRSLERLLPDNIDNIRLIIDINDIAARYHLQTRDVSVSSGDTNSVGGGKGALGSVTLSFTVFATYNDFQAFLMDLQRSLRIVDVESISFSAPATENGASDYKVSIKTYWLR